MTTPSVYLRRFTAADLPILLRLNADGEAASLLWPGVVRSEQEAVLWIQQMNVPPTSYAFAVMHRESGVAVGLTWFHGVDGYNACIGFGLEAEARRKGIAMEAGVFGLDMAFNRMGLRRLTAGCIDTNESCLALMNRLGFKEEGRMRKATLHNGEYRDNILFGLLAEEWRA